MFYRKAYDKLVQWKNDSNHKAICVTGARQIGKTTTIRAFGQKEYKCFVEVNFISDQDAFRIFDGALDADSIIMNLTAYTRKEMIPGETLVLLDEIQECPNARTAIKFLVEDGRFDYVESGSLLGIKNNNIKSYPVGFEEIYQMYPMDLEEFMYANGVQQSTIEYLHSCFDDGRAVSDAVHETMCKLFYCYMVVGGMPDVVQTYVDTHDIARVIARQKDILELYRLDISQYAEGNDRAKIRAIFDSIPAQLNEKNRRFKLSSISASARQERYADCFNWLADAGVALPCYNVSEPKAPLKLNEKYNLFKLFMGDTGLLCALGMDNVQFDILKGNLQINMGSILENLIAQQLRCNGFNINYYDSKKIGEVDFVVQDGTDVDLIEAKSGNDYHSHASLDKILKVDEWNFKKSIVLAKGNVEVAEETNYYPWYMIMFIKPFEPDDTMIHKIDISKLKL